MRYIKFLAITILLVGKCYTSNKSVGNILLIVNYNFAHYESIPLIKKIYQPYINTIVFYGPEEHPDVHLIRHINGYLSYLCIADAMERYPDFDGYLFLMDDCILNAWNLKNPDLSKIWYPEIMHNPRGHPINVTKGKDATEWAWWHTQWGSEAIISAFNEIPENYKKVLAKNWGASNVVAAYSDLVYIPRSYKNQFIELATIFGRNGAFLESALPTIISCLSDKKNWVWLHGWGTDRRKEREDFREEVYFNHPVKLSDKKNCSFIKRLFKKKLKKS